MIRIPPDATIVTDSRLSIIRASLTLSDRHVKAPGGLIDQVKSAMTKKGAGFAQSELVLARLQPASRRGVIDARKAMALFKKRNFSVEDLIACCTVRKEAVKNYLSEGEIERITDYEPEGAPSLITEFKSAIDARIDCEDLAAALGAQLARQLSQAA